MIAQIPKSLTTVLILVTGVLASSHADAGFFTRHDRTVRLDLERGHVEVQIVQDRGGTMAFAREGENRWVFDGSTADLVGGSYSIVLRNRSPERIKIVVGIDGVNVYRKDAVAGRSDGDTGSILSPWEERTLRGWQMDHSTAQQFVFSPPEWSEGQGRTDSQIGLLAVHVYRERRYPCRDQMDSRAAPEALGEAEGEMRKKSAAPQIGTTSGDDVSSHVRTVTFNPRTIYPEAWAEIDYGRCRPQPPSTHDRVLGMYLGSDPSGVRVVAIDGGSEADQAGIAPADLIVRIDTEDRPSVMTVADVLRSKRPGEYVFLRIRRGRHEIALKIRV